MSAADLCCISVHGVQLGLGVGDVFVKCQRLLENQQHAATAADDCRRLAGTT